MNHEQGRPINFIQNGLIVQFVDKYQNDVKIDVIEILMLMIRIGSITSTLSAGWKYSTP